MNHLPSLRFVLAALALAAPMAAQGISVTDATPSSAVQGTINLNVTISGKGFKNGANSKFFVTGTTNPGGVVVHSTAFVNSSQIVANIDVSSDAVISGFDVAVDNPDGHNGKGTDTFSVIAPTNGAQSKCTPAPLPSNIALQATFNATTGAPRYTSNVGKVTRGRLTTVLGQSVVLAAAGGNGGVVEVFFLDPTSGAVLDGTWGQPHLTLTNPEPTFYDMLIDDVNGDGVPDLVVGAYDYGVAWVFLGVGGGAGTLSFQPAILLNPGQAGYGAAIAAGNLDGSSYDSIAVTIQAEGTGRKFVPGKVYLYKFNGTGFTNYLTITSQQTNSDGFGTVVAIGDVTGDSVPDLVVGARGSNGVWVYSGAGLSHSTFLTNGADGLGYTVGIANLTGAPGGFNDLFATNDSLAASNPKASVFAGPVSSSSTPAFTLQPVKIDVADAGLDFADIDGDGLADIVIGEATTGCSGSALVYLSSPSYHSYSIAGPLSSASSVGFGWSVSSIPGTHLFIVGDKNWTGPSGTQSGQVYVYKIN